MEVEGRERRGKTRRRMRGRRALAALPTPLSRTLDQCHLGLVSSCMGQGSGSVRGGAGGGEW